MVVLTASESMSRYFHKNSVDLDGAVIIEKWSCDIINCWEEKNLQGTVGIKV